MLENEFRDWAWEEIHQRWPLPGRDPWSETSHLPDCIDYDADAGPFQIRLRLNWPTSISG